MLYGVHSDGPAIEVYNTFVECGIPCRPGHRRVWEHDVSKDQKLALLHLHATVLPIDGFQSGSEYDKSYRTLQTNWKLKIMDSCVTDIDCIRDALVHLMEGKLDQSELRVRLCVAIIAHRHVLLEMLPHFSPKRGHTTVGAMLCAHRTRSVFDSEHPQSGTLPTMDHLIADYVAEHPQLHGAMSTIARSLHRVECYDGGVLEYSNACNEILAVAEAVSLQTYLLLARLQSESADMWIFNDHATTLKNSLRIVAAELCVQALIESARLLSSRSSMQMQCSSSSSSTGGSGGGADADEATGADYARLQCVAEAVECVHKLSVRYLDDARTSPLRLSKGQYERLLEDDYFANYRGAVPSRFAPLAAVGRALKKAMPTTSSGADLSTCTYLLEFEPASEGGAEDDSAEPAAEASATSAADGVEKGTLAV